MADSRPAPRLQDLPDVLVTPEAGDLLSYTGTKWDRQAAGYLPHAFVIKATDESLQNSTTLQNDDALLFSVSANTNYVGLIIINHSRAGGTVNLVIDWSVPTGASYAYTVTGQGQTTQTSSATLSLSTEEQMTTAALYFHIGATAGTVNLQWAQSTSSSNAITVHAESWMVIWEQQSGTSSSSP